MAKLATLALLSLLGVTSAQSPGSTPEVHPPWTTWKCTKSGGCVAQNTSVVLDWDYRPLTQVGNPGTSCKIPGRDVSAYTLNQSLCPNAAACAKNCEIQGVDYAAMGVTTSGGSMTLRHYVRVNGQLTNATPRVYILGPDGNYVMMKLLNMELSYETDVSDVPCGENAAAYLSEMHPTGGRNDLNPGGANYGSGYCDAQCPTYQFRNGTFNASKQPFCCNEMDIQEANSRAMIFTPHSCDARDCDRAGCGTNPYSSGQRNFYGPGMTVDTTKPFTVVTQFIANGNTLSQIKRFYVQNGRTIRANGADTLSSCGPFGGLPVMGQALQRGMVMAFSIWNDAGQNMAWMDQGNSGPCQPGEGTPQNIMNRMPDTHAVFSNFKWGEIGSTVQA